MRRFVVLGVVAIVAATLGVANAAAQTGPTLTVTPSTDLDWQGETIQIDVTDRAQGVILIIGLCRADLEVPPTDLGPLLDDCRQIGATGAPSTGPFSMQYEASVAASLHCIDVGCMIAYGAFTGIPDVTLVEYAVVPITFTEVPEAPPTHPDFAMTVTPSTGLVHGQQVQVQVVHRNPLTTTGSVKMCLEGVDYANARQSECTTRWSGPGSDDVDATITIARTVPSFGDAADCVFEECVLVYIGAGSGVQPITEQLVQPLEFAPAPPVFTAAPTTDLVQGDPIDVTWDAFREVPTDHPVANVRNFVGICVGDAGRETGYRDFECEGVDLGPEATSGSMQVTAKRFIETGRYGTVDCLTYEYGCIIGYSLEYTDLEEFVLDVVLHQVFEPLTFRQETTINGGTGIAPVGSAVPVTAYGAPTTEGAVAFVMACGFSGGWTLQCDGVGSVEHDFDGSIIMPAVVEGATADVDCRTAPGCLIVFLVIGPSLTIVGGGVDVIVIVATGGPP